MPSFTLLRPLRSALLLIAGLTVVSIGFAQSPKTNATGGSTIVPALARAGMSVVIQN